MALSGEKMPKTDDTTNQGMPRTIRRGTWEGLYPPPKPQHEMPHMRDDAMHDPGYPAGPDEAERTK